MTKKLTWAGFVLAVLFLILTITNASWLAPYPAGAPKQIANGAFGPEAKGAAGSDPCGWTEIEPPYHRHIPNTRESILRADRMGAWLVEVDPQVTADGEVVLLADDNLDCLTDGSGPVIGATLDEVAALDPGFGYRVDDADFPLRGQGQKIPTLADIAKAIPPQARLMIHLSGDNADIADAVADALADSGRDPVAKGDGFYGGAAAIARIQERYPDPDPGLWAFSPEAARQCTADYIATGWTGFVPSSCENGTMLIALDGQAFLWGWPNRLIARLQGANAKILIEAPGGTGDAVAGITLPEQLTQIPSSFNGYIWTDDAFTTVPALVQRYDNRTQEEIDASEAALERRRKRQ